MTNRERLIGILESNFSNMLDLNYAGAEFTKELTLRLNDSANAILKSLTLDEEKMFDIVKNNCQYTTVNPYGQRWWCLKGAIQEFASALTQKSGEVIKVRWEI